MELRDYQVDIIDKTRDAFRRGYKRPLVVMPCGSGKTVCFADMAQRHIEKSELNNVWFLVHRKELVDQTEEYFVDENNIFIGMVQTISRHPERYKKPTLIIFDEAHHATSQTWKNIINYFEDVPMIGLTATPCRLDGKPLGNIFDNMIVGVESEWLMERGYLAKYDYYAPLVHYNAQMKGSDFNGATVEFEKKVYGDVEKYLDFSRKTIIYSPSIKFSQELCERIPGIVHFDGNTPKTERDRIVEQFRSGEIRALSNVDLIGEGFDVPDCDTVILLRPTMSTALFIQQSMRCLRPAPFKNAIIYDLVGNVFRHGMPTDKQEWSLSHKVRPRNTQMEKDFLVRECLSCHRVYKGTGQICPYCGANNGKTQKQIEEERTAELQKLEEFQKKQARMEVGRARSEAELIRIGKERGYKNPAYWAKQVLKSRKTIAIIGFLGFGAVKSLGFITKTLLKVLFKW